MVRAGPRVSAGSGRAETGSSRQEQGWSGSGTGPAVQRAEPLWLHPGLKLGASVGWTFKLGTQNRVQLPEKTGSDVDGAIAFPPDWRRLWRVPGTARRSNQSI